MKNSKINVRVPRVVLAALVGSTLALSGATYQGVFRNALADPYLLGVAAGAGLGATLAISPAVGAIVGVEAGAGIGATIGVLTAQPLPSYTAVAVPNGLPGFYDTWPPGDHPPPVTAGAPPPPPG